MLVLIHSIIDYFLMTSHYSSNQGTLEIDYQSYQELYSQVMYQNSLSCSQLSTILYRNITLEVIIVPKFDQERILKVSL